VPTNRLRRREKPAKVDGGADLIDNRPAGHVLDQDLRLERYRRIHRVADEQRQGIDARRVDGVERKAEFGNVLVGSDGKIVGARDGDRDQHQHHEGQAAQRWPGVPDDRRCASDDGRDEVEAGGPAGQDLAPWRLRNGRPGWRRNGVPGGGRERPGNRHRAREAGEAHEGDSASMRR
jgi:hypothetical protein